MYKKIGLVVLTVLPLLCFAQVGGNLSDQVGGLHAILDQLYQDMIPLCSNLIAIGRGLAGFAALWYIAARVWRHLANAEPIDFYPLFRPFVIGFAVIVFPMTLDLLNGILKPTVAGTTILVENSDKAVAELLKRKEEAVKQSDFWQMYIGDEGEGDRDLWYKYYHPEDPNADNEGFFEGIGNDIKFAMAKASYRIRNTIKEWMAEVLQLLFLAASLCINTMRTFNLVVLAILGPFVFGLSVFDGFQHTLRHWLARYINVFMWLPVANICGAIIGKIQEKMLALDIQQVQQNGDTFFSRTDVAYLAFLIIGIICYTTVPSIANYIVHAGGGGALSSRSAAIGGMAVSTTASTVYSASGTAASGMMSGLGQLGKLPQEYHPMPKSDHGGGGSSGGGAGGNYMQDKISGNT